MSPRSKKEYTEAIYLRYKHASRQEKTLILNEFCATCGYHRKHATRLLRGVKRFTKPKPKRRGKHPVYQNEEILKPLKKIWLAANLPCSKRLKAILPIWLPGYIQLFGELVPAVTEALVKVSPATIDRLLKPTRINDKKRGRSPTKPGFLEADSVAHCGESLLGMYAYTIDTVDIATGWTEQRAVWGKGETGVLQQIKDIEQTLPFPLLGFDCDNGSQSS